jgi:hypothetical protein
LKIKRRSPIKFLKSSFQSICDFFDTLYLPDLIILFLSIIWRQKINSIIFYIKNSFHFIKQSIKPTSSMHILSIFSFGIGCFEYSFNSTGLGIKYEITVWSFPLVVPKVVNPNLFNSSKFIFFSLSSSSKFSSTISLPN